MSVIATVRVTLIDNSRNPKSRSYEASRVVKFPVDPLTLRYIHLKVGKAKIQFTVDYIDWEEGEEYPTVYLHDHPVTNGDFRPVAEKEFFKKNSGWKVNPQ